MSAPRDSSLVMRKLADIPMTVCASPLYIATHGKPALAVVYPSRRELPGKVRAFVDFMTELM